MVSGYQMVFPAVMVAQDPLSGGSPANSFFDMLRGSDFIGMGIVITLLFLSVVLVAFVLEHIFTIRHKSLIPPELSETIRRLLMQGQLADAETCCRQQPCFLSSVLQSGISELKRSYGAAEKAMEDSTLEQTSRLMRKIEYLAVIGNIAPMLGLLGTVWGMLLAFGDVPQDVASRTQSLARDISVALWTTVLGLLIAIPALTSFAIFRNRIAHFAAECTLQAEHAFSPLKRARNSNLSKRQTSP